MDDARDDDPPDRTPPLPRGAVLASRVVLGVLSGAAAVVIALGW